MSLIKKNGSEFPAVFSDLFDYDNFFNNKFFRQDLSFPAANVKETEKDYKVELSVPGFDKKDIKVNVENEILTISAEKKEEKKEEKEKYTRQEFSQRSFSRSFQLPKAANSEKIQANYINGILHLEVAKKEEVIRKSSKKEIAVQ